MGFFSRVLKHIKKNFTTAVKIGLAYATGGTSAAISTGAQAIMNGGFLDGTKKKSSPVTGAVSSATSQTQPVDNTAAIAKQEQQKRLALNAGADTPSTALGVLGKPTVTKKKLLGA